MSVYFVTCREANAVKIGSSNDPFARLGEIQWGCPLLLTLEAVFPGDQEQEFGLHRRFADDRIRGEWFTITPMIEAMMAQCETPEQPQKAIQRVPLRKRQTPVERQQNRFEQRRFRSRVMSGEIHFPFRAKEDA